MKNEDIIHELSKQVDDKKDFILKLLEEWQYELDETLLDSVYFITRKNIQRLARTIQKTDLSNWSIISPCFIKDKIKESEKYYFVGQMFYLIYRWTDTGKKDYCNTNNATSDKILEKWLKLAEELKFFEGDFFKGDDYMNEYKIFLKNWRRVK